MDVTPTPPADPAPLSARERSRQATRQRLLDSARRLFAEHGIHRITTHTIARGAGVAAGTFYLHFPDKESVFREIAYEAVASLRGRMLDAMAGADGTEATVRAHAEALIAFAEEHSDLIHILFGRDHGLAELESDVLDYMASTSAELLRRRRAEGTLPAGLDPEITAQATLGMFTRTIVWWLEDPSRTTRESVIRTLIGIQLGGTYVGAGPGK